MKRIRRWLLIFTVLVCWMAHAGALRPPSLKASTTTTTTTTTTEAITSSSEIPIEEEVAASNTTSHLTGIPQIDYVWDPNLPRELHGYNLSDYPFFSTVPTSEAEIGFKCDGLHDGFYASIKHKCQVYHHCIYGIRHDFLCANFTAFDQRTFICHFVSEVDCKNSDKFWFRNDALYKATTTPSTSTTSTVPPPTTAPLNKGRPFRRPLRRRRPVDYYYDEDYEDDYYEERVNRRQKQRPRPRRPEYDEEYDEDRYNKRPYNRERSNGNTDGYSHDRRPVDRPIDQPIDRPIDRPLDRPIDRAIDRPIVRPIERPIDRPIDRPAADRPRNRNRPGDSRRYNDDEDRFEPRKPGKRRRPVVDDLPISTEERRPTGSGSRRFNTEDRRIMIENRHQSKSSEDKVKYNDDEDDRLPLIGRRRQGVQRRPFINDDNDQIEDRPLRRPEPIKESSLEEKSEEKVEVVPPSRSSSGSLFDRPRVPPRIAPPVPINERKKFGYPTTTKSTTPRPIYDDEYYDDYDYLGPPKKIQKQDTLSDSISSQRDLRRPFKNPVAIKEDAKTRYETVASDSDIDDYEDAVPAKNPRPKQADRNNFRTSPKREEIIQADAIRTSDVPPLKTARNNNYSDRDSEPEFDRPRYKEDAKDDISANIRETRPAVRVVKRPFLPSRGGSPYLPRGLQPVGLAQQSPTTETTSIDMGSTVSGARLLEHGPPIVRANVDLDDYPPPRKGPRTTQQPQIDQQKSVLDEIYDSEYDVTLNDALNPTLKPITRGLPTGFSHSNKFNSRISSSDSGSAYQDSLYSSTDSRRTAIQSPANSRTRQTYYDDYDYS